MAEFQNVVPVLKVSDMQKSVDFYTGVLGFSVAWQAANDGGGENCMLQAGATDLLLSTGPRCRRGCAWPGTSRSRRSTGRPAT